MAKIKDSGDRREFDTGAVRDMAEGKGYFFVAPIWEFARLFAEGNAEERIIGDILLKIAWFRKSNKHFFAVEALELFCELKKWSKPRMLLEAAHQYEDGARKYGLYNWQKGIPQDSYMDSAIRHLLKDADGMDDEDHARAFVWNMFSWMWQVTHEKTQESIT